MRRGPVSSLAVVAGLSAAASLLPGPAHHARTPPQPRATAPATSATQAQLLAQDHASAAQQRFETDAMARRRLLDHLPLTTSGVRISVAGLAADDRTVLITAWAHHGTAAHARAVYRDVLTAYVDPGSGYRLTVRTLP